MLGEKRPKVWVGRSNERREGPGKVGGHVGVRGAGQLREEHTPSLAWEGWRRREGYVLEGCQGGP